MKKMLTLALALLLLVCLALPALASEPAPVPQPRFTDVASVYGKLARSGDSACASILVETRRSVDFSFTITIQQKKNGRWTTIDTFSSSDSGYTFSFSGTVDCQDGQSYQAIIKGTAGADSINLTKTMNT